MARLPIFQVQDVTKTYRARAISLSTLLKGGAQLRAVSNVSLEINAGEVFGIIGESGSGKSTLGFALADIEPPTDGSIIFQGRLLKQMNGPERKRFRQAVQVVFQDSASALNPRRRVGAVLRDSLRLRGVPRHARQRAVERLLTSVGLSNDHANRYPYQLSGGQRQRIGIARALAMEPEVLIADEPVSALDVSLQGQIINLLLDLRRKFNLTVVLISHDIAVVHHTCQRIAVMYAGEVVETGTTKQVIESPRHPYTIGLIAAVPQGIKGRNGKERRPVGDDDADPEPGPGCPFAPRCPLAMDVCLSEAAPVVRVANKHLAKCHALAK